MQRLVLTAVLMFGWLVTAAPAHAAPAVEGPGTITVGQSIRLSGTGWTTTDGSAGSVLAFKLDDGAISTKSEVRHPVTDAVQANKTIYAVVKADDSGAWTAELPFPTTANASAAWEPGAHSVRILTGSLAEGDVPRTVSVPVEVVAEPTEPEPTQPEPTEPEPTGTPVPGAPDWPHLTATSGSATAWIEAAVASGSGHEIRLRGTGWTTSFGGGSSVAVKVNRSATAQYTRSGDDIVDHPSASGDNTIWALIEADEEGRFDVALDAPANLAAGQYLSVTLLSGRFASGDVQRSVTSDLIVVGGVPHEAEGPGGPEVTCVAPAGPATATATVERTGVGGSIRLTGTGWCHPGEGRGGSTVAVKIDEGAFSRTDTRLHQNTTIWAIVDADPATGELDAEIDLPDGKATGDSGSVPAFGEGSHSLRLLSGSLKAGDTIRTVQSNAFTVGSYRPTSLPDPVEYSEALTASTRGLSASLSGSNLVVIIPGAPADSWVALSVYHADGSPEFVWGSRWFRTDARGRASVPASGLPDGRVKVAAQSGDEDRFGELLGWTWWGSAAAGDDRPRRDDTARERTRRPAANTPVTTTRSPVANTPLTQTTITGSTQPTEAADAPATDASALADRKRGKVGVELDGTVAILTVPKADPYGWVHPFVYPETGEPIAVGWVQADESRTVRLDLAALGNGAWSIAVVGRDGAFLGWADLRLDPDEPAAGDSALIIGEAPAVTSTVPSSPILGTTDWWLLGAGVAIALGTAWGTWTARRKDLP